MEAPFKRCTRPLHQRGLRSRVHHIPGTLEMTTDRGQTVHDRRLGVVLPGRPRDLPSWAQLPGQHGDQRTQGHQDRRGAGDGLVGPWALGGQPPMGSSCVNGYLDRLPHDAPIAGYPSAWRAGRYSSRLPGAACPRGLLPTPSAGPRVAGAGCPTGRCGSSPRACCAHRGTRPRRRSPTAYSSARPIPASGARASSSAAPTRHGSEAVVCRAASRASPARSQTATPPRRLQGTGTTSRLETHCRPTHRMTWRFEERTASRDQPVAGIVHPARRSTGSSAPKTSGAPEGTGHVIRTPHRIRRPWWADHVARCRPR